MYFSRRMGFRSEANGPTSLRRPVFALASPGSGAVFRELEGGVGESQSSVKGGELFEKIHYQRSFTAF
jgi:hypothetical protein